jgi:hypothetical protein
VGPVVAEGLLGVVLAVLGVLLIAQGSAIAVGAAIGFLLIAVLLFGLVVTTLTRSRGSDTDAS